MSDTIVQLVPLMIVQGALLFGLVPLARRMSPHWAWLWIVLGIIPALGVFVFMIVMMRGLAALFDRVDFVLDKIDRKQ